MTRFLPIFTALLVSSTTVFAYTNVVDNQIPQTITNAWDAEGDMIVGNLNPSNVLSIVQDGSLTNVNAILGNTSSSSFNTATVSGTNASWISTGNLIVGNGGSGNSLLVTNGGYAQALTTIVGTNSTGKANQLIVTGTNTIFNTASLQVGAEGVGNTLVIADGATVWSGLGIVGNGFAASNNMATITGSNSTWTVDGDMIVGNEGSSNLLHIADKGQVNSTLGVIGWTSNALNNAVIIEGEDSVWNNASDVVVGLAGSGNRLEIINGGAVSNINGYVGNSSGASNNTVLVSGSGSSWINSGNLYIGNVGVSNNAVTVTNGGLVSASDLVISTNNGFTLENDGELVVTGEFFDAGKDGFNWNDGGQLTVLGQLAGLPETNLNEKTATVFDGTNKQLTMRGSQALWSHGGNDLIVGLEGSANRLIVTNGANVVNADAYVGYGAGANSNRVVVTGTNSLWENEGTLTVGSSNNTGNAVSVSSGGKIMASNLVVNAGGSLNLNEGGTLAMIGDFDSSDPLAKFNWNGGGTFSVGGELTGIDGLYGTNQFLVIDGGLWATNGDLTIGSVGFGNNLTIQNNGVVSNANAFVGFASTANSNSVLVTGKNSTWVSAGTLTIGATNNVGNSVTVTNSGHVEVQGLTVADGNEFNLDKDGSLAVSGAFDAGQSGFVWGNDSHLITQSNLTGLVTLAGTDQTLTLDGGFMTNSLKTLNVGWNYSTNTVQVVNGGRIEMDDIHLGRNFGSDGNSLSVSGTKSAVNAGIFKVGTGGNRNTLHVGSMGRVTNDVAYVGYEHFSDNNSATVSGAGATWVNGTLNVGWFTNSVAQGTTITNKLVNEGNSVTVSNGGVVQADSLVIQTGNDFNLNDDGTLRMTGDFDWLSPEHSGLEWGSGGNLSVGGELSGLTNINAGRVLTIDGIGASWSDAAETNMTVSGGAVVNVTNAAIVEAGNLAVQDISSVLNVSSNAWMLVGDGASTNALGASGGLMVASANGAMLTVDSDATVNIAETILIGADTNSTGIVSVSNGGTISAGSLVIADTNSAFNLENGGTFEMTGSFDASMAGFNWTNGGTLSVAGALSGMSGALDGEDRTLTLDGGNWNEGAGDLTVGLSGSGNSLNIENGGGATNANGYIGYDSTALNNAVTVTGSNSVWNNSADLYVGYDGSGNSLTIEEGGEVISANGYVGFTSNALDNAVVVTGNDSVWNNAGMLQIGSAETNSGNSVTVSANGTVMTGALAIEEGNSFSLNDGGTLRMTGDIDLSDYTSTLNWNRGGNLSVGGSLLGKASTNLVVEGTTNTVAYLSSGRVITIDGSGANWENGGDTNLLIGFTSSKSKLVVANGGTVDNADGFIGWSGSAGNSVFVSGTDSTWINRGNLYVGGYPTSNGWVNAGNENSLTVSDGGWVLVGDAVASDFAGFAAATNGAIAVASTTGSELVIDTGTDLNDSLYTVSAGTLFVGAGTNMTGRVDVRDNSRILLNDLVIADTNSSFNLEGELVFEGDFDADMAGFNWLNEGSIVITNGSFQNVSSFGGTNKMLTLNDSDWNALGSLNIGTNGSGNALIVNGNSTVDSVGAQIGIFNAVNNSVTLSGSNVVWNNTGDLDVGYTGSGNSLTIKNGATNFNLNVSIGTTAFASNNWVMVSGSNTLWNNSGNLYVGDLGSNNTLTVESSAVVKVGDSLFVQNNGTLQLDSGTTLFVGTNMTIRGSTLTNTVASGNSTIMLGSDVVDSTLTISGTNTVISDRIFFDAGGKNTDTDTVIVNDSTFTVSANTSDQYLNFEALELNDATLRGAGTFDTFDTINMTGGVLEPSGGVLVLPENFTILGGQPLLKITADGVNKLALTSTNTFNLSDMNAEVTIGDVTDAKSFNPVILESTGILSSNFVVTTFNEGYLLFDFNLVYTNANQVSVTAKAAVDGRLSSSLAYAGSEGIRAGFNGMKNAVFTRTKQLRRNVVATAHSIPHEAFLLSNTNAPAGAQGPGDQNTIFEMRIWLQQFSGQADYDEQGLSHGFTLNNNGTTIGADRLFGDALTAGFNYTYARSDARTTNNDTIDTETYWIGGYAEWVSLGGLYVDTLLAYGSSDYNAVRIADNSYRGTAKYDGSEVGGYVDVGQYYHYKNLALSPYMGVHALSVSTDEFTESGPGGNDVNVASSKRSWVESAFGLKARHRFDTRKGRIQTTGYAEWLHDFIQDDVDSQLSAGGLGPISTARISPDADVIGTGLGLSWTCTEYMEIGVGYNGRFSDGYEEHSGSILVDVRF